MARFFMNRFTDPRYRFARLVHRHVEVHFADDSVLEWVVLVGAVVIVLAALVQR